MIVTIQQCKLSCNVTPAGFFITSSWKYGGKHEKNSIKYSRINGEVQRELSRIISREIKDPRIHPMTSVVSVEVTPDLKFAKVCMSAFWVMRWIVKIHERDLQVLPHIFDLNWQKSLNLRNTPELHFVIDDSIEYGVNMSKRIDELTHHTSETEE